MVFALTAGERMCENFGHALTRMRLDPMHSDSLGNRRQEGESGHTVVIWALPEASLRQRFDCRKQQQRSVGMQEDS